MDKNLIDTVLRCLDQGVPCALGMVVETRGATPQKPGAHALFLRDGRVIGTLGGGCLEMESRRRALQVLDDGRPLLFQIDLDDDFGWDDGLLCGGRATVFARPVSPDQSDLWRRARAMIDSRLGFVMATFLSGTRMGAQYLIPAVSSSPGEDPAPPPPPDGLTAIRDLLSEESPRIDKVSDGEEELLVYLHPVLARPTLLIVGAGHIGKALADLADPIGFDVVVVDDREEFANRGRFPHVREIVVDDIPSSVHRYPVDEDTYVVIVTRGHRHEAAALRACINRPARYIGMIGSRRKVLMIFRELLEEGYTTLERLRRVRSPIGLDLGGHTVGEIALSIAAELVAVRRKGDADKVESMRRQRAVPWTSLERADLHRSKSEEGR